MTGKLLNQYDGKGHRFHRAALHLFTKQRRQLVLAPREPNARERQHAGGTRRQVQEAEVFTL